MAVGEMGFMESWTLLQGAMDPSLLMPSIGHSCSTPQFLLVRIFGAPQLSKHSFPILLGPQTFQIAQKIYWDTACPLRHGPGGCLSSTHFSANTLLILQDFHGKGGFGGNSSWLWYPNTRCIAYRSREEEKAKRRRRRRRRFFLAEP